MGNTIGPRKPEEATGKVVLSDGRVQNFEEETTVAEIMLENPQHVVVEFDPSSISFNNRPKNDRNTVKKKLIPLHADKKLEPGKIYLVFPSRRRGGSSTAAKSSSSAQLTSDEIRRMVFSATAMVKSSFSYYEGILPWFTTRSFNNNNNLVAADAVVVATSVGRLEEEEGRPEFLSRQLSSGRSGWKPSLDPIKEKKAKKKIHQRLF